MESNLKSPPQLKTELLFTHISHYGSISKGTGRNIYILVCVHESQEAEAKRQKQLRCPLLRNSISKEEM